MKKEMDSKKRADTGGGNAFIEGVDMLDTISAKLSVLAQSTVGDEKGGKAWLF